MDILDRVYSDYKAPRENRILLKKSNVLLFLTTIPFLRVLLSFAFQYFIDEVQKYVIINKLELFPFHFLCDGKGYKPDDFVLKIFVNFR